MSGYQQATIDRHSLAGFAIRVQPVLTPQLVPSRRNRPVQAAYTPQLKQKSIPDSAQHGRQGILSEFILDTDQETAPERQTKFPVP